MTSERLRELLSEAYGYASDPATVACHLARSQGFPTPDDDALILWAEFLDAVAERADLIEQPYDASELAESAFNPVFTVRQTPNYAWGEYLGDTARVEELYDVVSNQIAPALVKAGYKIF